jgi:TRAP-type C4-dicarboxylate transport system permease small subunit
MKRFADAGRDFSRTGSRSFFLLLRSLDAISRWLIIVLMALMTSTVILQVFFRYVLNDSIDAADEISRVTFVWSILLAIPHGLKNGAHVGIDLVVGYLRPRLRAIIFRLTSAAGIILLLVVAWEAFGMARRIWDQPMPTLPLSNGLFYIGLLISMVHSALHLVPYTVGWSAEPSLQETSE